MIARCPILAYLILYCCCIGAECVPYSSDRVSRLHFPLLSGLLLSDKSLRQEFFSNAPEAETGGATSGSAHSSSVSTCHTLPPLNKCALLLSRVCDAVLEFCAFRPTVGSPPCAQVPLFQLASVRDFVRSRRNSRVVPIRGWRRHAGGRAAGALGAHGGSRRARVAPRAIRQESTISQRFDAESANKPPTGRAAARVPATRVASGRARE